MADDRDARIAQLEAELKRRDAELRQARDEVARLRDENATLRDESAHRDRTLADALEQQQATSEILHVIATSLSDAQPVLDAIAGSALRLSDSSTVNLGVRTGDELRVLATINSWVPLGQVFPVTPDWIAGRAMFERRTIHIPD